MGFIELGESPTAAWILTLIGSILGIIGWGLAAVASTALLALFGPLAALGVIVWWFVVAHIIMLIGAIEIKSGIPSKVRTWGIIVLIFSILGGINILTLIGGILALVWKPSKPVEAPAPAAPESTPPI